MKIAYGILVHHRPRQFEWLFRAIHNPTDVFLVHIDRAAAPDTVQRVEALVAGHHNVHLMERRNVVWAGWSLADINLRLIHGLRRIDPDWATFVNLSGQDFPLRDAASIREDLLADPLRNHIEMQAIRDLPGNERRILWKHLNLVHLERGKRVIRLPLPIVSRRGIRVPWKGSGWYCLSRRFCEWIDSDPLVDDVRARFQRTCIPDEHLMQTLVQLSPFADTVTSDCRREIVWRGGNHPQTLTMRHRERLLSSRALFARKFDQSVDSEILHLLASRIGAQPARRTSRTFADAPARESPVSSAAGSASQWERNAGLKRPCGHTPPFGR